MGGAVLLGRLSLALGMCAAAAVQVALLLVAARVCHPQPGHIMAIVSNTTADGALTRRWSYV